MPDIQNANEYAKYQQNVAEFIQREELSFLSTGTWDYSEGERPEDWCDEPWFSWKPCEMCGCHLGGNREYLYARNAQDEIVTFTICEDCVYYTEYGRLDDQTMMRIGE